MPLQSAGVAAFGAEFIQVLPALHSLVISGCEIDCDSGVALAGCIKSHAAHLNGQLIITENSLVPAASKRCGDDSTAAIVGALTGPRVDISELDFHNVGAGEKTVLAVANLLERHSALSHLILDSTRFTVDTMTIFVDALKGSCVQELSICNCSLNSDRVEQLFAMIADNHTLTTLDVSDNAIDDKRLALLGEALQTNNTLRSVSVSGSSNTFGGKGVIALAERIVNNMSLQWLDMKFDLGVTNIKAGTEAVVKLLQNTKNVKLVVDARSMRDDGYVLGVDYPDAIQRRLFKFPLRNDVSESGRTLRGGAAVPYRL